MRLRLPLRFNGAGLIGVDAIGAAAFTASVVTSAHEDSVLMAHIACLTRFATPALARLRACLDQLGAESVNAHLRLPHLQLVDLFNPSRYMEITWKLMIMILKPFLNCSESGREQCRWLQ